MLGQFADLLRNRIRAKGRFVRRAPGLARAAGAIAIVALAYPALAVDEPNIRVGISNTSSDSGIFIAQKKGYFRDEGLTVTTVPFDSAAKMIGPLGAGQLDAGAGSAAAGLYNAVGRGIKIQVVADAGSSPPGYGHNILLVRKQLVENGRFKGLRDLKGMRVALTAPGASSPAMLNDVLEQNGLKFSEVEPVYLGYPSHVTALANGGVDAALTAEPSATQAINAGSAVRITSDGQFAPFHVGAVLLFSGDFTEKRKDAAARFMRAYVKGIRFYNGALKDGRFAGPNADELISILTEASNIKDPAIYRAISPPGCNPDGIPNVDSLKKDFDFYKSQGWIEGNVTVDQAVNLSFVNAAVAELGPYTGPPK
jgi:NitT/TauT family transport system substrate-binding protein